MDMIDRHAWRGSGALKKLFTPDRKMIDTEARRVEFIVSTGAQDRDGDIVDPAGWQLDEYRRNPVILWGHRSDQPPVGKSVEIGVRDGALRAVAEFADAETYPFADTVFRLYAGGYLRAVSAGFMPEDLEPLGDGERGYRMTRQSLWEFSAVTIPSNPEALVAARSKGIDVKPVQEEIERALDEGDWRDQRDLLAKTYVQLTHKVHPSEQARLARQFEAKAEPDELEVGDFARWDSSGGEAQGQITAIERDGEMNVPDSELTITGTEEDPAALIRIFQEDGDGWRPTDTIVGHRFSTLRRIDPLEPPTEEDGGDEDKAPAGETFTTSTEEGHSHQFVLGGSETAPAEDDGHIHAVTYDEDGRAVIEMAEGHTHEAPEGAVIDAEGGDDQEQDAPGDGGMMCDACRNPAVCRAAGMCYEGGGEKSALVAKVTDFPEKGDDRKVSLRNSNYPRFPRAEAISLRDNWPEIWRMGGNEQGNDSFADLIKDEPPEATIRRREAWAARHVAGGTGANIAGVVALVKWLVVSEAGLQDMRAKIREAKESVQEERARAAGISITDEPEPQSAGPSDELLRAVGDVISRTVKEEFRRLAGRV